MKASVSHHQQQSWIDNELNAQEMLKLEERLSPTLLEQLQLERTFQKQLGEQLTTTSPECPDALWNSLKDRMSVRAADLTKSTGERKIRIFSTKSKALPWLYKAGGLAACATLAWSLSLNFSTTQEVTVNPSAYLNDHKFAYTGRREKLMAALHHKGFFVELKPETESAHPIIILGLDFEEGSRGIEARLVYSCCDEPVIITIQHQPQQLNTLQPQHGTAHHLSKNLGNYYIQALSLHNPSEALDLVF
jgi:hypothetical protein